MKSRFQKIAFQLRLVVKNNRLTRLDVVYIVHGCRLFVNDFIEYVFGVERARTRLHEEIG